MKWETGILSPPSSTYKSSNWMIEDSVKTTIWTPAENKLFENALAKFDNTTPDRWQRVAEMVPGKTVADVIQQYKELEDDISSIEAGFYPKHRYNCSNSNFVLEWGNNCEFDEFTTAYGGRGKRSAAVAAVPVALVAAGRPLEQERKKGIPWTEEEHKLFLLGLKKYGKGDWRNISRNFVVTRTPTQVASHAQKYFIRQLSGGKDKRRASIHDITTVNINESNHISSQENKTTISPEQRQFQWSQPNSESIVMDFNQTHVDFFMSNAFDGSDGGDGCCDDDGLHQSYGAPNNMIFQIQPTYPL